MNTIIVALAIVAILSVLHVVVQNWLNKQGGFAHSRRAHKRTAEQAFTPKQEHELYAIRLKKELEEATGVTITRLIHGTSLGLKWVRVDFTWKWNGYVTESASIKRKCENEALSWELKNCLIATIRAEMKLNEPNWWY